MSNTLTNIRKSSGGHSGLGSYLFPQKVRPKVPESPNIKALTSRRIFTLRRSHSNYYHRLYTSSHYRFDPYSDPYHGKTGRHTLTSNKIYFSKKSGIATLSGTWSDTPAHSKIQYIPVRIPPSPPKKACNPEDYRPFCCTMAVRQWHSGYQLSNECLKSARSHLVVRLRSFAGNLFAFS